jgi:hypothetical protein
VTNRINIGPKGSKLDWDNWGKPITDAVNEHDTRLSFFENGISNARAVESAVSPAAYTNVAGTSSFSFTKLLIDTRIRVDLATTQFFSAATAGVQYAALISGTDYQIAALNPTTAGGQHLTTAGFRYITGITAGTYTIQLRWLRAGTGTMSSDALDWLSFSCRELV